MTLRYAGDRDLAQDRALGFRHIINCIGEDVQRTGAQLSTAQHVEIKAQIMRYAKRIEILETDIAEFNAMHGQGPPQ